MIHRFFYFSVGDPDRTNAVEKIQNHGINPDLAQRAITFINMLKHTKGEWHGKNFDLLPWQTQIISDVFGTVKPNGYRQYNTAYVEIPKKQGKSELAAAVALYLLAGDGEWGAEVYGCAADRQQASIVFDVACQMVEQCPALKKRIKPIISQDTIDLRVRRDHVPYDTWLGRGQVIATEGNVIHYGYIENFIEDLGTKYHIKEIAFDRWGAVQMVQNLEGMGFTVVPFGQGFKDMSPPTKELMKLVLEKKIAHGGNVPLRWMMDNVYVRTDPAGNIKMDKEKSTERIDGAVATVMALDRAIRNEGSTDSVYNERGIIVI